MFRDLPTILYWWVLLFGLGSTFFPLTFSFFSRFFDQGYVFSKVITMLLVSYFIWLLGSLKILPFSLETILLVIVGLVFLNYFVGKAQIAKLKSQNHNLNLKTILKSHWKTWLSEEALFLITLLFWSFVRGFQPNIQGLEKFMDYGFVNSILRSKYFPPADMWLAGETINYYYFGHLVTAVLTKLSGLDSAITYNLMIATIFALCFTAAFSLGGNLVYLNSKREARRSRYLFRISCLGSRVLVAGLLSATLLTLGGNLHPLWYFLSHKSFAGYWYPDATRFIVQKFGAADNTIHEFPIYSFVVADLHGHLLDLPFVLLFLGVALTIFIQKKPTLRLGAFAALLLAVMFMTNAWDFPLYFLFLSLVILCLGFQKYKITLKTAYKTALFALYCLLLAVLFSFPFHLHFRSIAQGIGFVDFRSPPWMLLVLWGLPLFATGGFIISLARRKKEKQNLNLIDYFVLILLAISWFLVIVPEFLYVKDIYIHSFQRANTMFKLTYQAFVMFSLSMGYIFIRILTNIKKRGLKILLFTFYFLLFTFAIVYPCFALRSYYGLYKYYGLYGLDYLKKNYPEDYQAIIWLKNNLADQPVIVEAVGESYTHFARVSTNTGLPTILGWRVHEWLWRGSFDEPQKRTEVVRQIYESGGLKQTKKLLERYKAKYLFLGNLERKQYPHLSEEKINQLGRVVFSSGKTKIYQLN